MHYSPAQDGDNCIADTRSASAPACRCATSPWCFRSCACAQFSRRRVTSRRSACAPPSVQRVASPKVSTTEPLTTKGIAQSRCKYCMHRPIPKQVLWASPNPETSIAGIAQSRNRLNFFLKKSGSPRGPLATPSAGLAAAAHRGLPGKALKKNDEQAPHELIRQAHKEIHRPSEAERGVVAWRGYSVVRV